MQERDQQPSSWRSDIPGEAPIVIGALVVLLVAIGLLIFWPSAEDKGTAVTDATKIERTTPIKPPQ